MRRSTVMMAGLVPVLATMAAITSATAATTGPAPQAALASAGMPDSPIKHVIEIMIENHTFDNLFGSFPGADGIPPTASFLNPNAYYDSAPNVSPVWATPNEGDVQGAINNSRVAEQMAMDYAPGRGYQMDHYSWPTTTSSRSSRRPSRT
jgi:phospholipase C